MDRNQNCFNKDVIMTKITIFKKNGNICEYQVKGHTDFEEEGKDIVCSAISVATQMALIGLRDVLKIQPKCEMKDGYLHVWVKNFESKEAQNILKTMELTLLDIQQQYSHYLKMEVKENA